MTTRHATYWHKHPRGFANECSIWRAETSEQAAALADAGYTRETYRDMRGHVAWIRRENQNFPGIGSDQWDDVATGDAYHAKHFLDAIERDREEERLFAEYAEALP